MTVVYATEEPPTSYEKSIFLAGPTPRTRDILSWRPEALRILSEQGYDGVVYVPEDRPDQNGITKFHGDYIAQIEWEKRCLNLADCIVFWVPRNLATIPAMTTNVEWGVWQNSGKAVFGAPKWAVKNNYLIAQANDLGLNPQRSLNGTLELATKFLGEGALRSEGEREVPLMIWNSASFQQWYGAQLRASNRLDHAKVEWTFHVGPNREYLFMWALHVDIYVAKENRNKSNEFVFSRPDISTIVAFNRGESIDTTEIVLVREFRSAASNPTGFVWELPGGSSFKSNITPEVMAAEEMHEETGLAVDADRFVYHESRQLYATLTAHQSHLFSVELTSEEINALKGNRGVAYGVIEDGERTYVEVQTLAEIRARNYVDWSTLGMIMQVLGA